MGLLEFCRPFEPTPHQRVPPFEVFSPSLAAPPRIAAWLSGCVVTTLSPRCSPSTLPSHPSRLPSPSLGALSVGASRLFSKSGLVLSPSVSGRPKPILPWACCPSSPFGSHRCSSTTGERRCCLRSPAVTISVLDHRSFPVSRTAIARPVPTSPHGATTVFRSSNVQQIAQPPCCGLLNGTRWA